MGAFRLVKFRARNPAHLGTGLLMQSTQNNQEGGSCPLSVCQVPGARNRPIGPFAPLGPYAPIKPIPWVAFRSLPFPSVPFRSVRFHSLPFALVRFRSPRDSGPTLSAGERQAGNRFAPSAPPVRLDSSVRTNAQRQWRSQFPPDPAPFASKLWDSRPLKGSARILSRNGGQAGHEKALSIAPRADSLRFKAI